MIKHLYGPLTSTDSADVFVMKNEHSYAAFVGVLSSMFMKAHACADFRTRPYKAAVVIDESMTKPLKNQPESSFERIKVLLARMQSPKNQIEVGIFLGSSSVFAKGTKVGLKHTVSQCWPLQLEKKPKKILSVNLPPLELKAGQNKVRYFTQANISSAVAGIKSVNVDYSTPIQDVLNVLSQSKAHVTYQGGTAWLSVCAGIPTIVVHPQQSKPDSLHLKFKLFGQDLGNINILNNQDQIVHVRNHPAEHHIPLAQLQQTVKRFL